MKYKVVITGIKGDAELNDVIDWTIGDDALGDAKSLAPNATAEFTVTGHMKETAGNAYQGKSIDGISITVVATQDTAERDTNGNTYDRDAAFPILVVGDVKSGIDTVLKDKSSEHTIKLTVPQGSLDSAVQKVTLHVVESADPATVAVATTEKSVSAEVTLKDQSGNQVSASGDTLFEVEMFIGKDRTGVKLYHSGVEMTRDSGTLTDVADHYVYDSTTGYITMKISHFSPFTAVYEKDGWDHNVAESYSTPIDETKKIVTIATAEELALFAKQVNSGTSYAKYTVRLIDDIDLGENMWVPIGRNSTMKFQGIFDGEGHTIRNLLINTPYTSDVGLFGFTTDGEIKNFTLDSAKVTGYLDVGAIAGTPYTSKYTNIRLTGDVQVNGYAYVGGMLGKNAYANLTDLTIDVSEESYVEANSENFRTYVGGLVGFMGEGNQVVENVTSNIDVIGSTCDVGGITGIAHYGNTFRNCHSSGDVTLLGAPDVGDELKIGGIAGVWHNQTGHTVTFEGCSYTGKLSSNNATTGAVTAFENDGLVGRKYGEGTGTLIIK